MRGTIALRRLADIVNGGTPTSDEENWNGNVTWATPVDLSKVDGGVVQTTERSLTGRGAVTGSATVPAGSVLLSTRAPIGYAATTITQCAFNQGCKGLVPRSGVDARFLRYFLSGSRMDLQALGSGSTFMELNYEALASVKVSQVEFAEQRRIADFLDDQVARIDNIIAARECQADKLVELMKTRSEELVWGGLRDCTRSPSGIGPSPLVPCHWAHRHNKHLLRESDERSHAGDEELLSVSHLTGVSPRSENVTMTMAESLIGYKLVRPGDLVINTLWAWMGALGVSRESGIVSPAYGVYRAISDDFEPAYFDYLYRSSAYVCEMTRYSKGVWSSRLRLYPEAFLALPVPVPPRQEQRELVAMIRADVGDCAPLVAGLHRSISMFNELKRSLITAAVNGEFDVSSADGSRVGV